ncbi:cysteine hydrolase family protein [Jiella pacifica]|uniref:Isochorismatase family protein n=1 Tax=Jiella pacifica TaxID=2696469 RepID=A0A6N9SX48_9HYPH|nr:isochorismatase family cysteine hydrolase [Jiella pacifica]NDW03653.1 isochorismatase family protein [Jiella pacifica]
MSGKDDIGGYTLGHLPGQRWTIGTDMVGTVRPQPASRPVRIPARPLDVEIDLARTALLVVDMQNDFLHPDGWFAGRGVDISPLSTVVPAIRDLSASCRAASIPVVWVNWGVGHGADGLPANVLFRGKRKADATGYGEPGALREGSWGAAVADELAPEATDLVVPKQRFSGFHETRLDSVLRNLGVTTLLFAGINIDRCVFETLTDAGARGYDCLLVEDACTTVSPPEISRAITWLIEELHGFVIRRDHIVEALTPFP